MFSLEVRWTKRKSIGDYRFNALLFYGILTLLTLTVIIFLIEVNSRTKFTADMIKISPDVILDAGHGGMDGGAVAESGVCEAPITLAISQKTQALFGLLGINALMTREDDASLDYHAGASARANKNADLKARLEIAKAYPGTPFISVHLNKFPQETCTGAQVFYSVNNAASAGLAVELQASLKEIVDRDNERVCKPSTDSVFLMNNITAPAVTVECGFLSNAEECRKMQGDTYQRKIALAIVNGFLKAGG